ncbi:hypothetical protein [Kaustia mangrovi]|uniref:hypothetical protein n=1 Tax=Kaustia mangrovi TaxID=2593653 RepID=UPI001FE9E6A1|nr:hypothetical protein [Kaustia mangrovi]
MTSAQDDSERVDEAWGALSGDERKAALDHVSAFLEDARQNGRGRICAGATYLRQKRWRRLGRAGASGPAKAAGERRGLTPFSREWWLVAVRRAGAARSPSDAEARRLRLMVQLARGGTVVGVGAGEVPSAEEVAAAVQIPWDGEAFEAWAHWFGACGVEVPRRDSGWVWVPSRWPPGYGPEASAASEWQDGLANGTG